MQSYSNRGHLNGWWLLLLPRWRLLQSSAKICCLAVEKPLTLANRTVRAGPRKDPLWSSRGIMKILPVDWCQLECVYGAGRISISQGQDVAKFCCRHKLQRCIVLCAYIYKYNCCKTNTTENSADQYNVHRHSVNRIEIDATSGCMNACLIDGLLAVVDYCSFSRLL